MLKLKTKINPYLFKVFTMLSCLLNVIMGGHAYQSFSVRNWDWKRRGKWHGVYLIDYVLGKDHCLESWVTWKLARSSSKGSRKEYRDEETRRYDITQW